MTPTSVTCPHCQTIFRITNAQLQAANGTVRCGSCLQIFTAMNPVERPKEKKQLKESIDTAEENTSPGKEATSVPVQPRQQPQRKLVAQQLKPVEKPETPPEKPSTKDLEPSVKAKVATAPREYDGYPQQSIETLIDKLEKRETLNEQQLRRKRTCWAVAACALMMLLVLQFAWFNRNTLSLNPALRPAYGLACSLLPCTLPPLVNINAIRSVNLVVRSHPDHNNALQVDAVIINEANHPQPFPELELTFTDIHGRRVANRTFTPSEYLGGELAGSEEMPQAQPIRLGLEIVDPGERAVNYQLTFSENRAARFN